MRIRDESIQVLIGFARRLGQRRLDGECERRQQHAAREWFDHFGSSVDSGVLELRAADQAPGLIRCSHREDQSSSEGREVQADPLPKSVVSESQVQPRNQVSPGPFTAPT